MDSQDGSNIPAILAKVKASCTVDLIRLLEKIGRQQCKAFGQNIHFHMISFSAPCAVLST